MKGAIIIKSILFIVISYVSYRLLKYYYFIDNSLVQKTLLNNETHFVEEFKQVINRIDLFKPNLNFSLSWKMKINNIPSNFIWNSSFQKNKPIILNGGCPNIYYNPSQNKLLIQFKYLDTHMQPVFKDIFLKEIKVQKWSHFVIVVKGRQVNIFEDGELKYSYLLGTVPIMPEGSLEMGQKNNNFLGKVKNLVYYNYPLKMNEIPN
jgi:hypothetical protein